MKKQLAFSGTGWFALVLTVFLFTGVGGVGQAQTPMQPSMEPQAPIWQTLTIAGVSVEVDAATGRLRPPTPEQVEALREALARRFGSGAIRNQQGQEESTPIVVQADGTLTAELPSHLHEVSMVRISPDGGLTHQCVQGLEKAAEGLASPAADDPSTAARGAAEER